MPGENLANALNTINFTIMIPMSPFLARQLSRFMIMNLYWGAHENGNQWKDKETQGFRQVRASQRMTSLRPMFWCIMICCSLCPPTTPFISRGLVTRKV
jgi:hypothetical protein